MFATRRLRRIRRLLPVGGVVPAPRRAVEEWRDEHGRLHRDEGPAWRSGDSQEWRRHGELHRLDGPALVRPFASVWAVAGRRHRTDGPAVVHDDGRLEWWVDGVRILGEQRRLDALHEAGETHAVALFLGARHARSPAGCVDGAEARRS